LSSLHTPELMGNIGCFSVTKSIPLYRNRDEAIFWQRLPMLRIPSRVSVLGYQQLNSMFLTPIFGAMRKEGSKFSSPNPSIQMVAMANWMPPMFGTFLGTAAEV
jgi:hypothetical protein